MVLNVLKIGHDQERDPFNSEGLLNWSVPLSLSFDAQETQTQFIFFFFSFLTTLCPAISVIIRNHFHYIWSNYSLWWGVKYISVIPLWLEVEITLILFFCVISFWGGCMCAKFGTDLQVWVSMLQKKIFLEPEGILKIEQKSFGSILLLMELEIEGLLFDLRGRIKFNLE